MSAYWTIYKNITDSDFCLRQLGRKARRLGMFHDNRWDTSYEVKLSVFGYQVIDLFGEGFAHFFPWFEDSLIPLRQLMPKIPALLERIPIVMEQIPRGKNGYMDILLAFLGDLGPTFRRIQLEVPTGQGWAIVAE